jgi:hypothetical protein
MKNADRKGKSLWREKHEHKTNSEDEKWEKYFV